MKIISLQAENFKKLQAIEITPDGNFVQITGKNGQGKSSTLDAIWVALAGLGVAPKRPIRKGAESAKIRLDLGEIIVTRHFKQAESGAFTTSLTVESAEGARYPSPQKMLDSLIGALSFDPIAFIGMEPKEQFNYCRRFVPAVDFDALANADRGDRQRREEIGRLKKQERAAATVIAVPTDTPSEEIDESALVRDLQASGHINADIERRRANREAVAKEIMMLRELAASVDARIESAAKQAEAFRDREVARLEAQIAALLKDVARANSECAQAIQTESDSFRTDADLAIIRANGLQAKLDGADPLPPSVDTAVLAKQIEAARATNAAVRKLIERNKHASTADRLDAQYKELSAAIDKREADKQAAIGAAQMPIDGLAFGDGVVLFNGVPLEQASDAEKLRVSVALSMAANPKLKVVFIRNGSLLDEDGLRLVSEMADKNDVQVWVERVASDGKVGIVLENGLIKAHEETT